MKPPLGLENGGMSNGNPVRSGRKDRENTTGIGVLSSMMDAAIPWAQPIQPGTFAKSATAGNTGVAREIQQAREV